MASDVTLCAKGCDDGVYTCFEYDFSFVPPDDGASTASKSAASLVDDAQDGRYFTDIIYNLADELAVDLKGALESHAIALNDSVRTLQRMAEEITAQREAEDREIRDETDHLVSKVASIQSTIAAFMDTNQKRTDA